jgi:serine/threonine protein kinase
MVEYEASRVLDDWSVCRWGPSSSPSSSKDEERVVVEVFQGNARLTRGAFGEISLAFHPGQRSLVAVKTIVGCIQQKDQIDKERIGSNRSAATSTTNAASSAATIHSRLDPLVYNELCALRILASHANICHVYAVYPSNTGSFGNSQDPSSVAIAMEYCPVDLALSLEWRRRKTSPPSFNNPTIIRTIAGDLCAALAHCHGHGIVHGDVKPGNLLVSYSGIVRLCDFGLSQRTGPDHDQNNDTTLPVPPRGLCTLYYRPPEVLLGTTEVHTSMDMYSAGTVVAELLTGRVLFAGRNVLDQICQVCNVLGTPDVSTWPEAMTLPDYSKLNFTPKKRQRWEDALPQAAEEPGLVAFFEHTVAWNPALRWKAQHCLAQTWLSFSPSVDDPAARQRLAEYLIPPELAFPPVLLTPPAKHGVDWTVVEQEVLKAASLRRNVLMSLHSWESR